MATKKRPEIPALTGLRGVAAYLVLLAHALDYSHLEGAVASRLAFFAMSLFFVLSGFVIQYNYASSFSESSFFTAASRFFVARFARLYPLYVVGLILSVSFTPNSAFFAHYWVVLSCLTLTQTWFNVHGATGDLIGYSWSISTEFALYLFFVPLASVLSHVRHPLRGLVIFCIGAFSLMLIMVALSTPIASALGGFQFLGPHDSAPPLQWLLYFSPLVRSLEFFAGVLAAQAIISGEASLYLNSRNATALTAVGLLYCVIAIIAAPRPFEGVLGDMLPNFLFAPGIVAVILAVSCQKVWLTRFLSRPATVAAGEISYSVYLLSVLVFMSLANSFAGGGTAGKIGKVIYAVLITSALGYGVFHLFESPARRIIRRMLSPVAISQ